MEFLLELLLTAVVALLISFLVAKIVYVSMAGENDRMEKTEIGVGDGSATVEELRFNLKMDAPVAAVQSERKLRVAVDENVEHVDRVVDELEEIAKEVELVVPSAGADDVLAALSPENVVVKEMIVRGEEETSGETGDEREELVVSTVEAASTTSESPENVITEEILNQDQEEELSPKEGISSCVENVERGEVVVTESMEVMVEESNTVDDDKMELNTEEQAELSIEDDDDDDDWEGIERSELEKAFVAASNLLEESGKGEQISAEVKMELYGLHKIATEGSCREAQPMALMLSARAKWNAWQKLGNMSPGGRNGAVSSTCFKGNSWFGKILETETSVVLPPNSGSLEDPTNLDTTSVASSKTGKYFHDKYESRF